MAEDEAQALHLVATETEACRRDDDHLPKSGEMDPVDREALERALQIGLREHPQQIQAMLADSWEEAAKFSAYSAQCDALNLAPWEAAPCHGYLLDGDHVVRDPQGGALADALTAVGLSVWEPDPQGALMKRRRRRATSKRSRR